MGILSTSTCLVNGQRSHALKAACFTALYGILEQHPVNMVEIVKPVGRHEVIQPDICVGIYPAEILFVKACSQRFIELFDFGILNTKAELCLLCFIDRVYAHKDQRVVLHELLGHAVIELNVFR